MDNLGVNFAPTGDNAAMGQKNASLAGVPQAIQVLSMALPKVIGARPVAPAQLLGSPGSGGNMGVQSALLQTILRTLGLPGGTAGPDQGPYQRPVPTSPRTELPYTPPTDPGVPSMPQLPTLPRIVTQPGPSFAPVNPFERPTGPIRGKQV